MVQVLSPAREKELRAVARRLQTAKKGGFRADMPKARTFAQWHVIAQKAKTPDEGRAALYYGFQPLFDFLADQKWSREVRSAALRVFEGLESVYGDFITEFYAGRPDMRRLRRDLGALEQGVKSLEGVPYAPVLRGMEDSYGIRPNDIRKFLEQFVAAVRDGRCTDPEYIVGCASGASEIALPLGRLLGRGVGFLGYRTESGSRIIPERYAALVSGIRGNDVCVVDEIAYSGDVLRGAMRTVRDFGARRVYGTTVADERDTHELYQKWDSGTVEDTDFFAQMTELSFRKGRETSRLHVFSTATL